VDEPHGGESQGKWTTRQRGVAIRQSRRLSVFENGGEKKIGTEWG
jgi:hypothetical protein